MEEKFIETSVSKFMNEIPILEPCQHFKQQQPELKTGFRNRMNDYENVFFQKYGTQGGVGNKFSSGKDASTGGIMDSYINQSLAAKEATNRRYERLSKPPIENNPLSPPSIPDIDLTKEFGEAKQNFLDSRANTRQYFLNNGSDLIPQNELANAHLGRPITDRDPTLFQKVQHNLLHPDNPIVEQDLPQLQKLRDNIKLLGGIEDTVGAMEQSLKEFELKNLHEKYINYYQFLIEQEQQAAAARKNQPPPLDPNFNPFLPHPTQYRWTQQASQTQVQAPDQSAQFPQLPEIDENQFNQLKKSHNCKYGDQDDSNFIQQSKLMRQKKEQLFQKLKYSE